MTYREVLKKLKSLENPKNAEGMARFGIKPKSRVLGISMAEIRKIGKEIKKDHELAQKLWDSNIHDASFPLTGRWPSVWRLETSALPCRSRIHPR